MNPIFLNVCIGLISILILALVIMAVTARSILTRLLAVNTLSLPLIAILALYALLHASSYYMDIAIYLALISFVATLGIARYIVEGRLFK